MLWEQWWWWLVCVYRMCMDQVKIYKKTKHTRHYILHSINKHICQEPTPFSGSSLAWAVGTYVTMCNCTQVHGNRHQLRMLEDSSSECTDSKESEKTAEGPVGETFNPSNSVEHHWLVTLVNDCSLCHEGTVIWIFWDLKIFWNLFCFSKMFL